MAKSCYFFATREDFIICGHIATINTSPQALNIFKLFQKAIKKQCPYVQGRYWYSEKVKNLGDKYRLITISTKSPEEYDLKIGE